MRTFLIISLLSALICAPLFAQGTFDQWDGGEASTKSTDLDYDILSREISAAKGTYMLGRKDWSEYRWFLSFGMGYAILGAKGGWEKVMENNGLTMEPYVTGWPLPGVSGGYPQSQTYGEAELCVEYRYYGRQSIGLKALWLNAGVTEGARRSYNGDWRHLEVKYHQSSLALLHRFGFEKPAGSGIYLGPSLTKTSYTYIGPNPEKTYRQWSVGATAGLQFGIVSVRHFLLRLNTELALGPSLTTEALGTDGNGGTAQVYRVKADKVPLTTLSLRLVFSFRV